MLCSEAVLDRLHLVMEIAVVGTVYSNSLRVHSPLDHDVGIHTCIVEL